MILALIRLGDDAYGIPVREELARVARRRLSFGTVYATLERLESKGLVRSRLSDPTPERGGRRKRLFTPTGRGQAVLRDNLNALARMTRGVAPLWEKP